MPAITARQKPYIADRSQASKAALCIGFLILRDLSMQSRSWSAHTDRMSLSATRLCHYGGYSSPQHSWRDHKR